MPILTSKSPNPFSRLASHSSLIPICGIPAGGSGRLTLPGGRYDAGDIGTFTISARTGFFYTEEVVPEPSAILLLGSGIAMVAGWRWRKDRRQ